MVTRKQKSFSMDIVNHLHDWSLDASDVSQQINFGSIGAFASEKLPFPRDLLEDIPSNRGMRSVAAQKVVNKFLCISASSKSWVSDHAFARSYCIIVLPNLFSSEVGFCTDKSKWDSLIFRNIKTDNYSEITVISDKSIEGELGIILPTGVSSLYLDWNIKDRSEDFEFQGGLFFVWKDLMQK